MDCVGTEINKLLTKQLISVFIRIVFSYKKYT